MSYASGSALSRILSSFVITYALGQCVQRPYFCDADLMLVSKFKPDRAPYSGVGDGGCILEGVEGCFRDIMDSVPAE